MNIIELMNEHQKNDLSGRKFVSNTYAVVIFTADGRMRTKGDISMNDIFKEAE